MASTGQTVTHLPQPLHESAPTSGRKFVVAMGFRMAKRLAASIASQQHPQQLHMNATFCCTFSPICTRLCSRASSSRSMPSFTSTFRAMPCLISDWAVPLKVMQPDFNVPSLYSCMTFPTVPIPLVDELVFAVVFLGVLSFALGI